jgi:hypothetical protein
VESWTQRLIPEDKGVVIWGSGSCFFWGRCMEGQQHLWRRYFGAFLAIGWTTKPNLSSRCVYCCCFCRHEPYPGAVVYVHEKHVCHLNHLTQLYDVHSVMRIDLVFWYCPAE